MKILISEQQANKLLSEEYYYREDPLFKDNDIYDYVPTQAEKDAFMKDKLGHQSYSPPVKKEKKVRKYTGNAYLRRLSAQIDYGPIALMKWKKQQAMDNNPVQGRMLKVVPEINPEYKKLFGK